MVCTPSVIIFISRHASYAHTLTQPLTPTLRLQRHGGPVADPGDHVLRRRGADPAAAAEAVVRGVRGAAQDKGLLYQAQQQQCAVPPAFGFVDVHPCTAGAEGKWLYLCCNKGSVGFELLV